MADILDNLTWQTWAKAPGFEYAEVAALRIGRQSASDGRVIYYVRELNAQGKVTGTLHHDLTRKKAIAIIKRLRPDGLM